nr:winged helix-turn-helix domain-containing protein [Natrialba sp. INN-245]
MSPYEIERVPGFPAQTVYDWLGVVGERDLNALGDVPRPPNVAKLTPDQWECLTAVLNAPPTEEGYDAPAWTPELVHRYITDTFDVEYSLAHMYRVLARAGLSKQTAQPRHYKADPVKQQQFRDDLKKVADAEGRRIPYRRHRPTQRSSRNRQETGMVSGQFSPKSVRFRRPKASKSSRRGHRRW